jgi:hypothetical protein
MRISRLLTLSLTIVLFTLGGLILPVNSALAHCKGKHKNDPGCDDPGGDPSAIVYTVTLTGAFEFTQDMTLNSKQNQLKSDSPVEIERPLTGYPFLEVWNNVFEHCPHFFVEPTPVDVDVDVPGFTALAGKKGWAINKPGGVRVNFGGIPFPNIFGGSPNVESAWVNLALIGEIPFHVPFPIVGVPIELKYFQIYGQTEAGVTPRLACDDKNFETEDLLEPIFLTITAK